jgi:hypothetical protein
LAERFWAKVARQPDGCWIWSGSFGSGGYGRYSYKAGGARRTVGAHRFAWEQHFGTIPRGMHVCHHCDTPACVRPDHLFLGTPLINARDKISKGRLRGGDPTGEANGHAKLTEKAVLEIRARAASGHTQVSLAREFGVSPQSVCDIVARRRWKHI